MGKKDKGGKKVLSKPKRSKKEKIKEKRAKKRAKE